MFTCLDSPNIQYLTMEHSRSTTQLTTIKAWNNLKGKIHDGTKFLVYHVTALHKTSIMSVT
jgi:hypothetical protein